MVFKKFVEIGRIAVVNYGADEGKLAVVIDVVDGRHALVDSPSTVDGVSRKVINLKNVTLTDLVAKIPRNARPATLKKAFEKDDLVAKYAATASSKKRAKRAAKAAMNDFDRFKAMKARQAAKAK